MKKQFIFVLTAFLFLQNIYAQNDSTSQGLNKEFSIGDILVSSDASINPDSLSLSSKAYDELIVGVYREVELNKEIDPKRVKIRINPVTYRGTTNVKYNSENGSIKKGDPITSSSEPGVGMKATEKGIILGVALEDASSKEGLIKIRVLVQYFVP